jgi:hypothetical protein
MRAVNSSREPIPLSPPMPTWCVVSSVRVIGAIDGNLQVVLLFAGSVQNQVCGSTVHGDLQFESNLIAVEIGSASAALCAGNTIGGNLQIENNLGATAAVGNTVGGNLQDQNNRGATQVSKNVISGSLECQNDTAIAGSGNTAKSKQGQCSTF